MIIDVITGKEIHNPYVGAIGYDTEVQLFVQFQNGWQIINAKSSIDVKVKILREGALLPTYATLGSSGMDVRAYAISHPDDLSVTQDLVEGYTYSLQPNERILIKTGLAMVTPQGYEIQVRDRSGCALKNGIMVVNGVGTIDSDYRGEIGVILYNSDTKPFDINKGDRIAQLVLKEVARAHIIIVDDLDTTDRGAGGYGSTGKQT